MSGQSTVSSFGYNGLGDRLSQTVNGITTTYTLDLNTGLTQVLSDGSNTYVYGLGRIAQAAGTGTEYFLGDALGSVRQLTNAQSNITLAKSYQPYGETLASSGNGQSIYAYTSEQVDLSGLVYLRARYYDSNSGRFISKDTWGGDVNTPITYNQWQYGNANPIMYTDPSGHIAYQDIIPSWRPIFEALELCNPNEEPTGNPKTIGTAQSLENWIYGNSTQCGIGYTSYGFTCIPIIVSDNLCEDKAPVLIPSVPSQWPVPGKTCKALEAEHYFLMSRFAALDLRVDALYDKLKNTHGDPAKVKEIVRELNRLLEERRKLVVVIRKIKADAKALGCLTAGDWPDPN